MPVVKYCTECGFGGCRHLARDVYVRKNKCKPTKQLTNLNKERSE